MDELGISQTELARRSQISRARLNSILKNRTARVHPSTAARISKALGLESEVLDSNGLESEYLQTIAQQNSTLDFSGLGIVAVGSPMPMDRVFASLTVRETPTQSSQSREDSAPVRARPQRLATALMRYPHFFLLGDPGAGKTTTLRQLAGVYAAGRQSDYCYPPEQLVPVFVRLADWGELLRSGSDVDAIDAAVSQIRVSDPVRTSEWLHESAKSDRVLLLLDGLDEVSDPDLRGGLLDGIRGFLQAYPEVRVIVSSRTVGFDSPSLGSRFDTLSLEPLSARAIRDFAAAWTSYRHGHRNETKCLHCERRLEAVRHAILDNPRVKSLAVNPMMLSVLLLLQEAGIVLPHRRWDLYEKLSEVFLFSWEEKKRAALSGSPDGSLRLDDRELVWVLESLGLEMQCKDRALLPRWWITDHIRRFLESELAFSIEQANAAADALIWSLQERSGLVAERGPDRYGFRHLGIQEYFAARAVLASDDPVRMLQPYIYHPRWREVVRLVTSQLDRRRAPQLIRLILDDPDPAGRLIRRGLLTALGCLMDGAPVPDKALLDELALQASELGRSKWLGVALEAVVLLGELRSSRLRHFADAAIDRMLANAEETLDRVDWTLLSMRVREIRRRQDAPEAPEADGSSEFDSHKPIFELGGGEDASTGVILCIRPERYDADWAERVLNQLRNDPSPDIRAACATELGRYLRGRPELRSNLCAAMDAEEDSLARKAIAYSLGRCASDVSVSRVLEEHLATDSDPAVRGACAAALAFEAERNDGLRRELWSILRTHKESSIRIGAARGLARSALRDEQTRLLLLDVIGNTQEQGEVRVACLRALEAVLPTMSGGVARVLPFLEADSKDCLAQPAARILATYAAESAVKWSELPIRSIEQVLLSVEQPCQHYLDALRGLVDAKELRRAGVSREGRLKTALSGILAQVKFLFVFGSCARGDQTMESDIDLMVIGDLSLREVAPGLRRAEQELGRQVNAVVYSPGEWIRRCRERNPFVTQVRKSEKIFIVGSNDELESMAREQLDQQG